MDYSFGEYQIKLSNPIRKARTSSSVILTYNCYPINSVNSNQKNFSKMQPTANAVFILDNDPECRRLTKA